jgi:hypothetical protein
LGIGGPGGLPGPGRWYGCAGRFLPGSSSGLGGRGLPGIRSLPHSSNKARWLAGDFASTTQTYLAPTAAVLAAQRPTARHLRDLTSLSRQDSLLMFQPGRVRRSRLPKPCKRSFSLNSLMFRLPVPLRRRVIFGASPSVAGWSGTLYVPACCVPYVRCPPRRWCPCHRHRADLQSHPCHCLRCNGKPST